MWSVHHKQAIDAKLLLLQCTAEMCDCCSGIKDQSESRIQQLEPASHRFLASKQFALVAIKRLFVCIMQLV